MKTLAFILAATFAASAVVVATPAGAENIVDFEFQSGHHNDSRNAFGLGLYTLNERGTGFYGNLRTSARKEPYYDDLGPGSFGDAVTGRHTDQFVANVGITGQLAANFMGYVGVGYAALSGRAEQYDPTGILSDDGYYYVDDPARDHDGLNVNIGLVAMFDRLVLNAGYDSFLETTYVGIGGRF